MSVEEILQQAKSLSPDDQSRLVSELARAVLARRLRQTTQSASRPLPVTDQELNRLIHEARGEVIRAPRD
ncbi:hypothetical protein RAS2_06050 [Phycisphaerae bacterium RAS2]|nr:hypothetical protein RAS2_06050 [Phycisphaerae bacterium RAS2]